MLPVNWINNLYDLMHCHFIDCILTQVGVSIERLGYDAFHLEVVSMGWSCIMYLLAGLPGFARDSRSIIIHVMY